MRRSVEGLAASFNLPHPSVPPPPKTDGVGCADKVEVEHIRSGQVIFASKEK